VRRDLGAAVASDAARATVMPLERAGGQAQFITHEPPANDGTSIGALLVWLEQQAHRPLSLPAIARRAGMSTRTLGRHFRRQVGTTPARWLSRARVRRAQRLLETTDLSVERIAAAVGFRSGTVLREHFAKMVGISPRTHRRSFRS
jgi:transcriptional regulator GlxA family with amidase domain